jgi:hypothetical protein
MTSADFLDSNTIATRDYLCVRLWDIRVCREIQSHQISKPDLGLAYKNAKIFDRHSVRCKDNRIITTGYGHTVHCI